MVSVSLIPETDFDKEFIDEMVKVIENCSNVKLLLVGTDNLKYIGEKYQNLKNGKVKFIKYEKELGQLYQICDIYVNPKRNGGGYSIAEAMFYGIPVISCIGSEAGESWSGKENSLSSYKEYLKKIEKLYNDKKYYEEESKKMKNKIEIASYKKQLDEIYIYI